MMEREQLRLDEFPDITVDRPELVSEIMALARDVQNSVRTLRPGVDPKLGIEPARLRVNALLATAAARCRISPPPPADIELVTDASGNLVYRCKHSPAHTWSMGGARQ